MAERKRMVGIGASAPAPLRELAASVRHLIDRMLLTDEEASDALREAKARVDEVAASLEPFARSRTPRLGRPDEPDDARPYYVDGVMIPDHHPHAVATEMTQEDGVTRGTVNFGVTYEGPPGCVHGGVVASFFDQILGHHNVSSGIPAMTGTLTVRYHRPTPLYTDLHFEVRVRSAEGRKITTAGTLSAAGETFAEGEGLFILPSRGLFDGLES